MVAENCRGARVGLPRLQAGAGRQHDRDAGADPRARARAPGPARRGWTRSWATAPPRPAASRGRRCARSARGWASCRRARERMVVGSSTRAARPHCDSHRERRHGKDHQGGGRARGVRPAHQGGRRLPRPDQRQAGAAHQAAAHARPDPRHRAQADQQRRGPRQDRPAERLRLLVGHARRRPLPGQRPAAALVLHDRHAGDPVHGADHRVAPPARGAGADRRVGAGAGAGHRGERQRQELDRGGAWCTTSTGPSTSTSSPSRTRSSSCTAT